MADWLTGRLEALTQPWAEYRSMITINKVNNLYILSLSDFLCNLPSSLPFNVRSTVRLRALLHLCSLSPLSRDLSRDKPWTFQSHFKPNETRLRLLGHTIARVGLLISEE